MPTKVFKISDLSGGINSQSDETSIKDNESTSLTSFIPDRRGRLRLAGEMQVAGISYDTTKGSGDINDSIDLTYTDPEQNSGTGLFYFRADNPMIGDDNDYIVNGHADIAEVIGGIEYWVVGDNRYTKIYDAINGKWITNRLYAHTSNITTSGSGGPRPIYYFGDKALRVSAAHTFGIGGTLFNRRWLGFIERTLFDSGGDATDFAKWVNHKRWYQDTAHILTPTASSYTQAISGPPAPGKMAVEFVIGASADAMTTAGIEGVVFGIKYNDPDDMGTGTWETKTYTFYGTYIYDGSQESNAFSLGSQAVTADTVLYIGLLVSYSDNDDNANHADTESGLIFDDGLEINPRITGGRLYFSDPDDGDGILYHMLDFSFENGCRKVGEQAWTDWDDVHEDAHHETYECPDTVNSNMDANGFKFEDPPKFVTYDTINGYGPYEDLNPEFNCATMVGKRMYIGNVKINGTVHNDRIMRSPVNFEGKPQYDTFPETHFLEVGADDGDTIIELVSDADKLMVFKEGSVSVLNVGKFGGEYIENTFQYVGIKHRCQTVKTQYGVCWATNTGCYMLQQGKLVNLIEGKILISGTIKGYQKNMTWTIEDTAANYMPAIGYLPKESKLIIAVNIHPDADSRQNDCWMYDFKTQSWSYLAGSLSNTQLFRSNFINNHAGGLYQTAASIAPASVVDDDKQLFYWNTNSTSKAEARYATKDINFGDPALIKKVYKVGLTFKTEGTTNMIPLYSIDGSDDILSTFVSSKGILSGGGVIEAPASAQGTQKIKNIADGNWEVMDSDIPYFATASFNSEGGLSGITTMLHNDTNATAGNWTIGNLVGSELAINTITTPDTFQWDGTGTPSILHTFTLAGSIRSGILHTLTFNLSVNAGNFAFQILGPNVEEEGETTLVGTTTVSSGTGVQTVNFTPAVVKNAIKISLIGATATDGTHRFHTITLKNDAGSTFGLFNGSPSIMMMYPGSSTVNNIAGFISVNQTSEGTHYISPTTASKYQLSFSTGDMVGVGYQVRIIDMGSGSTAIPNLGTLLTYDAASSGSYTIAMEGDGIEGISADYATITQPYTTYTLTTTTALATSSRYYIVFSIGTTYALSIHGGILTGLSFKEIGNWHTGFLNLSSPVECKSFQLMLENSGTAHASFELRDVEFYYRTLRPKITGD